MIAEAVQVAAGLCVAAYAGVQANQHRPGTPWYERLAISIIGAAGLLAVVGVALARLPVIIDARATLIEHTRGQAVVHAVGQKPSARAICTFKSLHAYIASADGYWRKAAMAAPDDPSPGSTRPPGWLDFGLWVVTYQGAEATQVEFVAHHHCGWWMPETRTLMGPFALPPVATQAPSE